MVGDGLWVSLCFMAAVFPTPDATPQATIQAALCLHSQLFHIVHNKSRRTYWYDLYNPPF